MKRIPSGLALGLLGCFLLIASQAGAASDSTTEQIEARHVVEQYFSALNAGGLETIMHLYHADSVFLPKNAPAARGIAEITRAYRALFKKAKLNTAHVYHHVAVYGEVAIIESQGHGTLTLLASKQILPSNNKELFVLRKIGGVWKIDRYMFNDSEKPGV